MLIYIGLQCEAPVCISQSIQQADPWYRNVPAAMLKNPYVFLASVFDTMRALFLIFGGVSDMGRKYVIAWESMLKLGWCRDSKDRTPA